LLEPIDIEPPILGVTRSSKRFLPVLWIMSPPEPSIMAGYGEGTPWVNWVHIPQALSSVERNVATVHQGTFCRGLDPVDPRRLRAP